jgi:hypothetical protein
MTNQIAGRSGLTAIQSLGPSPENKSFKRYIQLTVFTPSGLSHSSQWLQSGTNAEFLRRESIVPEINSVAGELVISLQQHRFA